MLLDFFFFNELLRDGKCTTFCFLNVEVKSAWEVTIVGEFISFT